MRTPTPKVFAFSRYWRIRRRPNSLPLGWRPVAGSQGYTRYTSFREWLLVLNACGIPHQTAQMGGREYIYVPALYENIALTAMLLGSQLFLAGFLGDLLSRQNPNRNDYQIEKEIRCGK